MTKEKINPAAGSTRPRPPAPKPLLAAIVDSSDDAITSQDLHGTITSWNRSAERIFGYPAAEVIGRSCKMLLAPERQEEEEDALLERAACLRSFPAGGFLNHAPAWRVGHRPRAGEAAGGAACRNSAGGKRGPGKRCDLYHDAAGGVDAA